MSTRSITIIKDEEDKEICVLYRHGDGYPKGHGQDLVDFLKGKKIVNGITASDSSNFNGMNCLAAAIIAHFKTEIGGFYLFPAGTRDRGEGYIYTISGKVNDKSATITVSNYKGEDLEVLLSPKDEINFI
jgi:hypothetical protein